MLRPALSATLLLIALPTVAAPAKVERRCGWFENPTPANATLTDRDGTWEIASQGGYQAQGDWPAFNGQQWIQTHNHYGYGCACITASANRKTARLDNLTQAKVQPLATCRADPRLEEPAHPAASLPPLPKGSPWYQGQGFGLHYPKGWKLSKSEHCITLDHPKKPRIEEYTLHLCRHQDSLEQAADSLVFYQDHGVWMRSAGKSPPSPVQTLDGPGWQGLVAYQSCGVGDALTGYHAAGGNCLMALIYDQRNQVVIESAGVYQDFTTLHGIIGSIRFDADSAAPQD